MEPLHTQNLHTQSKNQPSWPYWAHFSGWMSGCVLTWFGGLKLGWSALDQSYSAIYSKIGISRKCFKKSKKKKKTIAFPQKIYVSSKF